MRIKKNMLPLHLRCAINPFFISKDSKHLVCVNDITSHIKSHGFEVVLMNYNEVNSNQAVIIMIRECNTNIAQIILQPAHGNVDRCQPPLYTINRIQILSNIS